MAIKSAILVAAGCISAAAAADHQQQQQQQQKSSQSRFLQRDRKRHNLKRGAAINRKLTRKSPEHELDITAEDVGFWTRTLQSSFPPTPRPTRIPRTPRPTDIVTPNPTDAPPPATPNPTTTPATPNPTTTPATYDPTPNPTEGPDTYPPTIDDVTQPSPSPTTLEPTVTPTASPTFPCNLTPEQRADDIRSLLATVSDDALFDDPATPQAQALDWITNDDAIEPILCPNSIGAGCSRNGAINPLVQRYVMAAFYYATDGPDSWTNCGEEGECTRQVTPFGVANERVGDLSTENWLSAANECEWGGVACWGSDTPNLNLCVDQFDFEDNGISGELLPEVSVLDSLRFLILEQGGITGPIPSEYGELERLLILDMDFNSISGSIPEEIYDLSSLQQLDLNDNLITGSISPSIANLNVLTFFQIDHNFLSDTIPSEMGQLGNLRIAFLSDNDLTGEMPSEVCALRNNTSPPGLLTVLVTDCGGENPEVVCPCCSSCAPAS